MSAADGKVDQLRAFLSGFDAAVEALKAARNGVAELLAEAERVISGSSE